MTTSSLCLGWKTKGFVVSACILNFWIIPPNCDDSTLKVDLFFLTEVAFAVVAPEGGVGISVVPRPVRDPYPLTVPEWRAQRCSPAPSARPRPLAGKPHPFLRAAPARAHRPASRDRAARKRAARSCTWAGPVPIWAARGGGTTGRRGRDAGQSSSPRLGPNRRGCSWSWEVRGVQRSPAQGGRVVRGGCRVTALLLGRYVVWKGRVGWAITDYYSSYCQLGYSLLRQSSY